MAVITVKARRGGKATMDMTRNKAFVWAAVQSAIKDRNVSVFAKFSLHCKSKVVIANADDVVVKNKNARPQEMWEKSLKSRFMRTRIEGKLNADGTIGVNLGSIADEFIREFRERLEELGWR